MPNRYVREAAIKSKAVNSLSWHGEVFWRRLLNLVDDFGRYYADPELLRADVFPRQLDRVRDSDIPRLLAECEKAGLLFCFEADGKPFLVMNQWEKGRALNSNYPKPPPDICERMKTSVYICKQMLPTPTPTPTPTTKEREAAFPEANVPTWDEVRRMAASLCIPETAAREFFDHHDSLNMWTNKFEKVIKVRERLMVWANNNKRSTTNGNHRKPSGPVNQRLHGQIDHVESKRASAAAAIAASEH